jgi:UDP-N-acetylglucosamine pyrophosphorylase
MLIRVDVENLIAEIRKRIEVDMEFARKRLADEKVGSTIKYLEGYESALSQLHRDISVEVHSAVVRQQQERGE